MSTGVQPTIALTKEGEGWVATHTETGVASQGETREEALKMLDEAVALHRGEIGEPIEDEEAFLRDLGIDSDDMDTDRELPDFLR